MGNIDDVVIGFIGVIGTIFGTILGCLLPQILNGIGRKVLVIAKVDAFFGTGEPDEEGGFDGSNLKFEIDILNKKNKNLVVENPICKLYNGSNLMETYCCEDENTRTESACISKYDEILYIDVQPKSSKKIKVIVPVVGNLSSCDKVVFCYSWGFIKRNKTIWEKKSC